MGQAIRFVWARGKFWLLCSLALMILNGLQPLAILWITKELINEITLLITNRTDDFVPALTFLLMQFFLVLLFAALTRFGSYLDRKMELRLDHDLQKIVSTKMMNLPFVYLELPELYHHLNRIQGALGMRFLTPIRNAMNTGKSLISCLSYLGFLMMFHWSLVLISLLAAIPIFFVQVRFGVRGYGLHFRLTPMAREAQYYAYLMNERQPGQEIRLFGLGPFLLERWSDRFWRHAKETLQLLKNRQKAEVALEGLTALFYLSSSLVMVWLARSTGLQIGDFVALLQAVQGTQTAVNQVARQTAEIYEQHIYIRDFFAFMEFEQNVPLSARRDVAEQTTVTAEPGIVFADVSFAYPNSERPALNHVSFHVRPGEKVAIVGENGSGKTTLVKCLMGLYPLSTGRIFYDGCDTENLPREVLTKRITVIFQDFMRYDLSVHDNIAFGNIDRYAKRESVEQVARMCGVDRFVERMPEGYDTFLGKSLFEGEELSGGQWQKLALARALFRDGDVVILDEPTAALDPEAELEVFQLFDRLTQGKTVLYISHRMAAARMADRIVVMKAGEVAEIGTHQELMAKDGEYARMYKAQANWYAEEADREAVVWKS
jgi:ATP-binding cassette subfamily B protein